MNNLRLKILPEELINKIAAGEVIERPASVVKELVENSIDAGATRIAVEIQEAGKRLIRVADNGCGMTEEEIKLALQRHSTSKISQAEDLFDIKTLGFRGEALPSIAGVSKTAIERNPAGSGLTVTVKDLFYNTPVRKKFLKSNTTETRHMIDVIAKGILACPAIAFRLVADGKELISSPGSGKLADAVLAVYGSELLRNLVHINGSNFKGYISQPILSRLDRHYETFFVNGRHVKNILLNRALEEGYRSLIPGNRYPAAIIFLEVDPKTIDVNVHPAKREVRFMNTREVMETITRTIREKLTEKNEGPVPTEVYNPQENRQLSMEGGEGLKFFPGLPEGFADLEMQVTAIQPLLPLYQLKNTYIVATDGEELVLIDQHAAHERIIYDRLSEKRAASDRQVLLIPETLELSAAEAATLRGNLEYLKETGFEIEEFGANTFIIRALPALARKVAAKQLALDLIADLCALGKSLQVEMKKDAIAKSVACRSAVKAGDPLSKVEVDQLIRDLFSTKHPLTCPHGRPTMVRLTEEELAKRFGRQ